MTLYKEKFIAGIYNIFFRSTFQVYAKVLRGVVSFEGNLNIFCVCVCARLLRHVMSKMGQELEPISDQSEREVTVRVL